MITKIKTKSDYIKIWKMEFKFFGSNIYLLKTKGKNILIDASSYKNKEELISDLEKLNIKPSEINVLLLTHNHWDHIQNINLLLNSNPSIEIYGSKKDFQNKEYPKIKDIKQIETKFPEIKIIETPGHTPGSVCIYIKKEKILFSGDTVFYEGIGRTDFPESSPIEMQNTLNKLKKVEYKKLCSGHPI